MSESAGRGLRGLTGRAGRRRAWFGLLTLLGLDRGFFIPCRTAGEALPPGTRLPYAAVDDEVSRGLMGVRRFSGRPFSRNLVLATSTQRPLTLAAAALVDRVKTEVRALHAAGKWIGSSL